MSWKSISLPQELVKFNQTFDKAVSRILSPVVVIVTDENATNRNYVHNLWLVTNWLSFTITNIISFYISNRLAVKHIQKKIEADSIYSIIEHLVLRQRKWLQQSDLQTMSKILVLRSRGLIPNIYIYWQKSSNILSTKHVDTNVNPYTVLFQNLL